MSFVLSPTILRTLMSALNTLELAVHFYLWTFLLLTTHPSASNCQNQTCQPKGVVKVSVLVPIGENQPIWDEMNRTAAYAFKKMNDKCIENGYELTYELVKTNDSLGNGLNQILELAKNNTDAFIGPTCEFVCQTAGLLARELDKAMFSYQCKSIIMSNCYFFKTFAKTTGTYLEMGRFLIATLKNFQFTEGVVIVTNRAYDIMMEVVDELDRNLPKHIMKTEWSVNLTNETLFIEEIKEYVVTSYVFLLCMSPESIWEFLTMVKKHGFFKKGLAFIAFDYVNTGQRLRRNIDDLHDFTGLLDITVDLDPHSSNFSNFFDEIFNKDFYNINQCRHYEHGMRAALMADTIELFARSLADCGSFSGGCIKQSARTVSFQGVTGDVSILIDGSRYAGFMLHNLVNGCYVPVGRSTFSPTTPFVLYETITSSITWPGYTNMTPKCPATLCSKDQDITAALIATVTVSLLVILILACIVDRRRQTLKEMGRRDWIITSERLFAAAPFAGPKRSVFPSGVKRAAGEQPGQGDGNSAASRESLRTMVTGQIYAKVTVLDQQLVAVKQVDREYVQLDANIITEINQVRRLKHTNINNLKGACIEAGNVCLVWGYCAKGSLRDVLQNENIRLDWMFKLSFICDIAKGMAYLHASPVNVHGRLKSTNVVVDINWCCKITDLDMPNFRYDEQPPDVEDWRRFYNLLWTAPEILRNPTMARGTKKGDVYAYGIIMHEVVMRTQPFGLVEVTDAQEVIHRVVHEENPPFRPLVPDSCMADNFNKISDEGVLDLMVMCWDEYPLLRLSFHTISSNLKEICAAYGSAGNLVDQMLQMVTKYADNLEELVEERTQQLAEEQRKTEELLSRMLPKSVAHELKMGKAVIPESYQSVTIFFSDIVGFTALASDSTPMQVVTMLNELYTVFDNCVDKHDAYKIETIGDAYMLVSGLPVRNGDLHAGEIATAALDILSAVLSFKIPHCPGRQLCLRVGIHSGPTVAGVVGQKMPRYCLFGDTVNYAASMESSGLPMHIHVSKECKEILDKLGGYHLNSRGSIEMKGKGKITTYFLKWKDGYIVNIPNFLPGVKEQVGIDILECAI